MGTDELFKSLGSSVAPYVAFATLAALGIVLVFRWMDAREEKLTSEIRAEYGPQIAELKARVAHVESALNTARPLIADALVEAARLPDSAKLTDILRRVMAAIS